MESEPESKRLPRSVAWFTGLVFCALLTAGYLTRDFGLHWDESFQVQMVSHTLESGSLLPQWYRYPSVSYWLSLASLGPTAVELGLDRQSLLEFVQGPAFKPRGRVLFFALSSLALVWVAQLSWQATRSRLATVLSVLILASSFEYHYHSRWMVTDTIGAQMVALGVWLACLHLRSGRKVHLVLAAVVAGLAAGTKYPGGLVLVPLCLAIYLRQPRELRRTLAWSAAALAILLLTFLVTTPGAVLDGERFRSDIRWELRHYSERGHGPYSVEPGLQHVGRMLAYCGLSALSFHPTVALVGLALAAAGLVWLFRRDWRLACLLAVLPAVYLLYFSRQRVMAVRNLQLLLPFLALFAACGVLACTRALRHPLARGAALLAVALALSWNIAWLVHADVSIVRRSERDVPAEVERFVRDSARPVYVGASLLARLGSERQLELEAEGKLAADPRAAELVVLLPRDLRLGGPSAYQRFVANRRGTYALLPSGPWEVNWDYYPTWGGDERPVIISSDYYRRLTAAP